MTGVRWLLRDARRWWLFAGLLLALAAGWAWQSRVSATFAGGQIPSPREGFPAPDFTLNTLAGEPATLSDYRGRVVVVNVWASWCGPCRAEMPALQGVYAAQQSRGLEVLAVNSTHQDSLPDAQAFVQELGLSFPILLDVDGAVNRRYLVRGLPTTFFIDRQGVIRAALFGGPLSAAAIQAQVDDLLNETP